MTEEEIDAFDLLHIAALRRRRELQQQQADRRIAVLASIIANSQGGKKNGDPFTPLDFHCYFPSLPRIEPEHQSLEDIDSQMERAFRSSERRNGVSE
jgi:hypothetical protein